MTYRWRHEHPTDTAAAGDAGPEFDDQESAEEWLGEHWGELRDAGVDAVTLVRDGSDVYGPMSLHPPAE